MSDDQLQLAKALAALDSARKQIKKLSYLEPIAIIGLGCRFPGGANNPESFWELLKKSFDASKEVPASRWNIDDYYNSDPQAVGSMISRNCCLLNTAIDEFDPLFFGISPREAEYLDPQQRLLLEVTWEALENAGINPSHLVDSRTGVFIGISTHDYADLLNKSLAPNDIEAYFATGTSACAAAGRISYTLGLKGPSIAIDTACSSSLVALHQACMSLRQGECDLIITGGVNILLSPTLNIDFSRSHMLAPDGHCKTFDKNADGYVRGEGCGIIILKRLSDAQRDGNKILAVIKSSAVNQDGNSSGLTVPNGIAQKELIETALQQAQLLPDDIDYIEAHGTGTSLGDPIEINAIYRVFGIDQKNNKREKPLIVGTVKTNIGHLEAAAGIAGIIKTVLSLQYQTIPKHLHFSEPNPAAVDFKLIPLQIPIETIDWKRRTDHIRRAGVSSFGFSGTNAYIILEEAAEQDLSQVIPSLPQTLFNRERYWPSCLEVLSNDNDCNNESFLKSESNISPTVIPEGEKLSYEQILSLIREYVLDILCLPPTETKYDEVGFFKLGMDSLMVVELKTRLKNLFPTVNLSSTAAYDYPTIVGLSRYIEAELFGKKLNKEFEFETTSQEPIAVIGVSCRFPAGANNPQQFWELLAKGFDAGTDIPLERWDMNDYYSDDRQQLGKIYTKRAGLLNIPIEEFDAKFFGISPREAMLLDPQQRLLLELTWEGLENARIDPKGLQNSLTGVFIGIYSSDYRDILTKYAGPETIESYMATGTACSTASGRISYTLGLRGPNFAIDTACSSSLVAVHQACQSLRQGESHLAIAGGVNVILSPEAMVLECSMQMLSSDGKCKTFDKAADGFMRAEGCGIVILKRLSDAQRDGDEIIAVIKGSAINQDGASSGLTVPNGPAQEEVIWRALKHAGLKPDDIDYIEAHGTGTPTGDPIEINAIQEVFGAEKNDNQRERPLIIGTVKTNLGHAEAASGIAGLIKTILALQHEMIPRHLHFKELNPALNHLNEIPAQLPLTEIVWPKIVGQVRRAGISSFAFSGTNAHVIIEEAPEQDLQQLRPQVPNVAFKRERYWIDGLNENVKYNSSQKRIHPLLGVRLPEVANCNGLVFEKAININNSQVYYLGDHQIFNRIIFPATAYVELFLAALEANYEKNQEFQAVELNDITIDLPLKLQLNNAVQLQTIISRNSQEKQDIFIYARNKNHFEQPDLWQLYAKSEAKLAHTFLLNKELSLADIKRNCPNEINIGEFYEKLFNQGLSYGKSFQLIRELYQGHNMALAKIECLEPIPSQYYAYPPLVDSVLQAVACFLDDEFSKFQKNNQGVYIPTAFSSFILYKKIPSSCYVHIAFKKDDENKRSEFLFFDLVLFDENETIVAKIQDFKLKLITRSLLEKMTGNHYSPGDMCYAITWQPYEISQSNQINSSAQQYTTINYDARNKENNPIGISGAIQLLEFLQKHAHEKTSNITINIITEQAYSIHGEPVILNQAMLNGFIKTAILECPTIIIRQVDINAGQDIECLIDDLAHDVSNERLFAYRDSKWYISRINKQTQLNKMFHKLSIPNLPYRLIKNSAGLLDEIQVVQEEVLLPGDNEIIIAPKAVGLNFRDVLNAMNLYPGDPGPLGGDCAGIVKAIGKNVTQCQIGDEVMGVALGALASQTVTHQALVTKKPDFFQFAQAASIPTIFLTAYYTLIYKAKLKKDDIILIHAGCGGVGLAAIQIAQLYEAQIIATAGSERKRHYLTQLGIKHVLDSRSLHYGDAIAAITNGQGVDIVLNSLTGPNFIDTSLRCCAKSARFIEISKRDIWSEQQVNAKYPSIEYHMVAVDMMMSTQPEYIQVLLQEIMQLFAADKLKPIDLTVFPVSDSIEAFNYLKQAQNIGKVIITLPPDSIIFDQNATYLITGGLGGIGLKLAEYLSNKGAARIVLAARSTPIPEALKIIEGLRQTGKHIDICRCDISDQEQVKQLINNCHNKDFPLKGIFHAAGVLKDALFDQQDLEHVETVFSSKAKGAWYLHEATKTIDLDYFVLFSSIASVLGSTAQANYALANSFLDGLAYYRNHQGLNAQSISWGPWSNVGMAKDLALRHEHQGFKALTPEQYLAVLDYILINKFIHMSVVFADWSRISEQALLIPSWLSELMTMPQEAAELLNQLANTPLDQYETMIKQIVISEVTKTLALAAGKMIEDNEGFFDMGMDSLMAAELVKRVNKIFPQVDFDVALVFNYASIAKLTAYIKSQLVPETVNNGLIAKCDEPNDSNTLISDPIYKMDKDSLVAALWSELNEEGKSS